MKQPINSEVPPAFLKAMGELLKQERVSKGINLYQMEIMTGLEGRQIKAFELGLKVSTDTFIRYLYGLGKNIRFTEESVFTDFLPPLSDN